MSWIWGTCARGWSSLIRIFVPYVHSLNDLEQSLTGCSCRTRCPMTWTYKPDLDMPDFPFCGIVLLPFEVPETSDGSHHSLLSVSFCDMFLSRYNEVDSEYIEKKKHMLYIGIVSRKYKRISNVVDLNCHPDKNYPTFLWSGSSGISYLRVPFFSFLWRDLRERGRVCQPHLIAHLSQRHAEAFDLLKLQKPGWAHAQWSEECNQWCAEQEKRERTISWKFVYDQRCNAYTYFVGDLKVSLDVSHDVYLVIPCWSCGTAGRSRWWEGINNRQELSRAHFEVAVGRY